MISLYSKKYQVFISSTFTDLTVARDEVIKVILNLYQIPIGMEMFSADNAEQWEVIQSTIENSDYYLLILGHRYGSTTLEGISYTEKEFDYAKSLGIPVIAFVKDRNIATKPSERDADHSKSIKLDEFYKKVTSNAMCDFWQTEHELGQKVAIALTKMFAKSPQVGWIKANLGASLETTEELTKLSRENRELRDELEQLKASINHSKPFIIVNLNGEDPIVINYKQKKFYEFTKITYSLDMPDYVSESEVLAYNALLDSNKSKIEEYKSLYSQYINKTTNQTAIKIDIANTGYIKAHDVYVDITFPPEIAIFEKSDRFKEPVNPIKQKHPLEDSREPFASYKPLFRNSDLQTISPIRLNVKRGFRIDTDSNTLTIHLDSLLHTRVKTIEDDIVIAPLSQGEFQIKVSVICNEFKERSDSIISIKVI